MAVGIEYAKKYFVDARLLGDWTPYPTRRSGWSERENLCNSDNGMRTRVPIRVRPILSHYGPTGHAYGGKITQLGGLCRDCQQKRGSDSRGRRSTRAFLPVRGRSAIVCGYRTTLFLIQQRAGDFPNTYLIRGFLHFAAVVEAVRMWEAFFAFHICITCFSLQNP